MNEISKKHMGSKDYFYYRSKGALVKSELESILYFKSDNRKIKLHKKNKVIEFYDRLNDVIGRIDEKCFWKVHQSYLININHVKKFEDNTILLDDGSIIPISKSYIKSVNKARLTIHLSGLDSNERNVLWKIM